MLKQEDSLLLKGLMKRRLICKMDNNYEVLEIKLDDKNIDESIVKLKELKNSRRHVHYSLSDKQIGDIEDNIVISELLIHHEEELV